MSYCTVCKVELYTNTKTGSYCNPCKSKYQSAWAKRTGYKDSKKRKAYIRDLVKQAKNKGCTDCKIEYPWYVMDFDHIQGEKSFNLSMAAGRGKSIQKIKDEIDKCDVVCANCHRIRTFNRK